MQFTLSTLMVMVAAVALGCMGWKLGDWMMHSRAESWRIAVGLYVLPWLLLTTMAVLVNGRLSILLPCTVGFVLHALLFLVLFGQPSKLHLLVGIPITAGPFMLFASCLYLARSTELPAKLRYGVFLPSCILFGWTVALFFYAR